MSIRSKSVRKVLLAVVSSLVALSFTGCSSEEEASAKNEESYVAQKESITTKEQKHPLKFLTVKGDDKKNLIGQTVIRGTITNKASIVAYKDVRVKMLCYKNGVMVEEHEDVISDVVKPNASVNFKTKYRLPKGTDSIAVSVMNAAVADTE